MNLILIKQIENCMFLRCLNTMSCFYTIFFRLSCIKKYIFNNNIIPEFGSCYVELNKEYLHQISERLINNFLSQNVRQSKKSRFEKNAFEIKCSENEKFKAVINYKKCSPVNQLFQHHIAIPLLAHMRHFQLATPLDELYELPS